jgi:hypothetical protein
MTWSGRKGRELPGGAIQSDALTLRTFAIRLVSITADSLRFSSEFATVMTIDAKRHAKQFDWPMAHQTSKGHFVFDWPMAIETHIQWLHG